MKAFFAPPQPFTPLLYVGNSIAFIYTEDDFDAYESIILLAKIILKPKTTL